MFNNSTFIGPSSSSKISNPYGQGTVLNTLKEWFIGPSDYSSAGKQRIENVKAREHATAERLASEAFNKQEAQIARDWQEYMSNTSYQRMMQDLQKAGINPLFAISQGGASTPSGVSARSSSYPSHASATRDDMADFLKLIGLFTAGISAASKLNAAAPKTTLNVINSGTPAVATKVSKGEYLQMLRDMKRDAGINPKAGIAQIRRHKLLSKGIMQQQKFI
jgi:hypothetical protein